MGTYKHLKNLIIVVLTFSLIAAALSGCGGVVSVETDGATGEEVSNNETTEEKIDIPDEETEEDTEDVSEDEDSADQDITIDIKPETEEEEPEEITPSSSKDVDLIFFMGQSNMSGCGGDATQAPTVIQGAGYEYKAVMDPFNLNEIKEPFGYGEGVVGGICDAWDGKKGSLVSSFVNEYYKKTGHVVIAVSASAGATSTEDWLTTGFVTDLSTRMNNAQTYLKDNGYNVMNQYVVWLQGESDALDGVSFEEYKSNMDTIIRPLFIGGFTKVFVITPGRIKSNSNFFNNIIAAQIDMCRTSGYYALASTMLCSVSTSYMVDEWHYNQKVLNLLGEEAADSVAYYTNEKKEMCVYDYKNDTTYIPEFFDYDDDVTVEKRDINGILAQ